jgi:hypothetical protein
MAAPNYHINGMYRYPKLGKNFSNRGTVVMLNTGAGIKYPGLTRAASVKISKDSEI